ncbi:MAG: HAMP domain-containing sensor histidine kinase [Planctomycetaceae bacterium]
MRWPIRNQILLPFLAIQSIAIVAIAVTTSWVAVTDVEDRIETQLASVSATLGHATFPLTPTVLNQLRALSGAEFLVVDQNRSVIETTIDSLSRDTTPLSDQSWNRINSKVVRDSNPLSIEGEGYYAGRVTLPSGRGNRHVVILFPQADWHAARWDAMRPPLLIGSVLLVLTILLSIVLSRRLGTRIHRVQSQVARIADGEFEPILPSPVNDELRDLALSVNRMAATLETSLEQVRESERSSLLTQLVGGLAHQFRNAITGARVSVQLHQRRCSLERDEALTVALKQLELTEQQIKALLRVTRGEQRSRVAGDVSTIIEETAALIGPICDHQQIDLQVRTDSVNWDVSDADALRSALLNLVMNAVEATGPHGRIEVETQLVHDELRITVADDGPGFPEEHDIFQTFFSTKQEGIGLGLPLARQAVEDCGGQLTAHRDEDRTIFELRFMSVINVDDETSVPSNCPSEMTTGVG